MICTFTLEANAQKLCDKIHAWLQENCKGYAAHIWQEPRKHPDKDEWFVKLPAEYVKDFYPVKVKLKDYLDRDIKKAVKMTLKLDADWKIKEINPIK